MNPPRYFPPSYFAGGYWSGAELPEGSMFATITAGATVTGTATGEGEGFIRATVIAGASVAADLTSTGTVRPPSSGLWVVSGGGSSRYDEPRKVPVRRRVTHALVAADLVLAPPKLGRPRLTHDDAAEVIELLLLQETAPRRPRTRARGRHVGSELY